MIVEVYGLVAGVGCIVTTVYLLINLKKVKQLQGQPLSQIQPSLAIVIPVRNEEQDLENALQSVCNINYNNYRIIVVNDRSTDNTQQILEGFSKRYPKLTVKTITGLPDGWLGKNNALYQGYKSSTEEWILFTDADIEYHPDAINKAMAYSLENNLDNLAVMPEVISPSGLLNSVLGTFKFMLMVYLRPWDSIKPKTRSHIGIGAFCLVKRTAYEIAGTHSLIKLRPDDDIKLGYNIKKAGLRQDVLSGMGAIKLEWYKNLGQFINGLMKNSFATANYNVFMALSFALACLVCLTLPVPVMLIWGSAYIKILAIVVLLIQMLYMHLVPPNKWWYALMIPFSGVIMAYVFIRSTVITVKQGGIYWRDSFYSLNELRTNK